MLLILLHLGIYYNYPNDVIYSKKPWVNQFFINHLHLPIFWREREIEEWKLHQTFMEGKKEKKNQNPNQNTVIFHIVWWKQCYLLNLTLLRVKEKIRFF